MPKLNGSKKLIVVRVMHSKTIYSETVYSELFVFTIFAQGQTNKIVFFVFLPFK